MLYCFDYQVQAIVDQHHLTDHQRSATKVRFTEPSADNHEEPAFNNEDESSLMTVSRKNNVVFLLD